MDRLDLRDMLDYGDRLSLDGNLPFASLLAMWTGEIREAVKEKQE